MTEVYKMGEYEKAVMERRKWVEEQIAALEGEITVGFSDM
jgi:hypothetical protein